MKDKTYEINGNTKDDGCQRGLAIMVCKFFWQKKPWSEASVNEELPQELHKPVIKVLKEENSMSGLKIIFEQQI